MYIPKMQWKTCNKSFVSSIIAFEILVADSLYYDEYTPDPQ